MARPNTGKPRRRPVTQTKKERETYSSNLMVWSLGMVILAIAVTFAISLYYKFYLVERIIKPLNLPNIVHPQNESLDNFWGTYRPHTYFGVKTKAANSPVAGLMWFVQFTNERPPHVYHWCKQDDHLSKYGWLAHDAKYFGRQRIVGKFEQLDVDFLKVLGGDHGGDWAMQVKATVNPTSNIQPVISLIFYLALDSPPHSDSETIDAQIDHRGISYLFGSAEALGRFRLEFNVPSTHRLKADYFMTRIESLAQIDDAVMHGFSLKDFIQSSKGGNMPREYVGLSQSNAPRGVTPNLMVTQVTVRLPYTFGVHFASDSFNNRPYVSLTGATFDKEFDKRLANFDRQFEKKFGLEAKGYSKDEIGFAKYALSNMLGGIGYWHGSSIVQSRYNEQPILYWEAPLLSAVPSRSFFPRGFLWDEGFHNLLISEWDWRLSFQILGHWLDLLNIEGWIPREQILDGEARARVPQEFVVQSNENANPPTFFLTLDKLIPRLQKGKKEKDMAMLVNIYRRLQIWYDWFNTTQLGYDYFTYRWRGRDDKTTLELNPKTLTSGLDDYPRASHPNYQERHVDLRCWMALASKVMWKIAEIVGAPHQLYQSTYMLLSDNDLLNTLHWSSRTNQYADYGMHSDSVRLVKPKPPANLQPGQRPPPNFDSRKRRLVEDKPKLGFVDSHFGYISLFPMLLHVLDPSSEKLGFILDNLKDSGRLWTPFGLRSLGKNSPLFKKYNTEHDPPYWRGTIWININYLAIRSLHYYSQQEGPYATQAARLYKELRENVIRNLFSEYKRTGYIWENYDDVTGYGKGSHPFTGWSSLVVLVMSEKF